MRNLIKVAAVSMVAGLCIFGQASKAVVKEVAFVSKEAAPRVEEKSESSDTSEKKVKRGLSPSKSTEVTPSKSAAKKAMEKVGF